MAGEAGCPLVALWEGKYLLPHHHLPPHGIGGQEAVGNQVALRAWLLPKEAQKGQRPTWELMSKAPECGT